jgi:hypothetical protein
MFREIRAKLGLSTIDHAFCTEVRGISWFSRCGHARTYEIPVPAQPIRSWDEAVAELCTTHWQDTTVEARNAFTVFLHKRFNRKYQLWNRIAEEAKRECIEPLSAEVWWPFAKARGLEGAFVHSIQWTVLSALMEHEYRDCVGAPRFFLYLLGVYRSGQLPCGWEGSWPNGKLLVH